MNNKILQLSTLLFLLLLSFSCGDDTIKAPLEYDSSRHVQGTLYDIFDSVYSWETIIDVETGDFDTIPGTRERELNRVLPFGPDRLTDFENNRRIYSRTNGYSLVIHDLESLEKQFISLEDSITGDKISFPPYIEFGNNTDELFVIDQYFSGLYRADLTNYSIERIADKPLINIKLITDIIFSKEDQRIILLGQTVNTTSQVATSYAIYDLASNTVIKEGSLPDVFGFAKHPTKNSIFCLTVPTLELGIRLVELQINQNDLSVVYISPEDLVLDDGLSTHRSTIHSATNSYICRGGSTHEANQETYLHRIDLISGELQKSVFVDGHDFMIKLAGE